MFYANNWPIISVTTLTILLLAGITAHQAHAKTEPLGRDALRAMVVTEALDLGLPVVPRERRPRLGAVVVPHIAVGDGMDSPGCLAQ